jgi:t-SNARE complex subunit (syntaxin)
MISNVELGTKNSVLEKGIEYARRKKRIGYGILYCVMIVVYMISLITRNTSIHALNMSYFSNNIIVIHDLVAY